MSNNNKSSEDIPLISRGSDGQVGEEDDDQAENLCDEKIYEDNEEQLENWQAYMHLYKCFVGVGILGLPSGVLHGGLWFGPIALFILGICCLYGMLILASTIKTVKERINARYLTFGEVTRELLSLHSDFVGQYAKLFIDVIICTMQLGFCCVYLVFLGTTLHKLVGKLGERLLTAAVLPFILGISLIRNVKKLAYFTTLANIVLGVALVLIMEYFVTHIKRIPEQNINLVSYIVGFGQFLYGFEGIGMVPTLEKKMRNKDELPRLLIILTLAITFLYFSFGVLGYLCFGADTKPSVALNLPDEPLYTYLNIVYMVIVFFTYPLQLLVPIDIVVSHMEEKLSERKLTIAEYGLRSGFVILTFVVAITVPQLDNVMALIASFSATIVTFVFPTMLHTICFWNEGLSKPQLVLNVSIFVFGVVVAILGSFGSVFAIVRTFEHGKVT